MTAITVETSKYVEILAPFTRDCDYVDLKVTPAWAEIQFHASADLRRAAANLAVSPAWEKRPQSDGWSWQLIATTEIGGRTLTILCLATDAERRADEQATP